MSQPAKPKKNAAVWAIRVAQGLEDQVAEYCAARRVKRSYVVRAAVEKYVKNELKPTL